MDRKRAVKGGAKKWPKFTIIAGLFIVVSIILSAIFVFAYNKISVGADPNAAQTNRPYDSSVPSKVAVGVQIPGSTETSFDIRGYVKAFYTFAIKVATPLVTLMVVYAGYIYLFSQGDTTKINQAKDILVGSILGYLLLLTIGVILNFIGLPDLGIKSGTQQ